VWAYRNKKVEPAPGIKLVGGLGPQVKRFYVDITILLKNVAFERTIRNFLNIVAAHIEGLRHPPIYLFGTLFSRQFPFKGIVS
jgi:hypothetical protein